MRRSDKLISALDIRLAAISLQGFLSHIPSILTRYLVSPSTPKKCSVGELTTSCSVSLNVVCYSKCVELNKDQLCCRALHHLMRIS